MAYKWGLLQKFLYRIPSCHPTNSARAPKKCLLNEITRQLLHIYILQTSNSIRSVLADKNCLFAEMQTILHTIIHFNTTIKLSLCATLVCATSTSSVRLSVCPSVTFRYVSHTGWNTSKQISRLISLRFLLILIPIMWAICSNGNTPKIRAKYGWGHEHKKLQYLWNGARKDQGYYDGLIGSRIRAFDLYQKQ